MPQSNEYPDTDASDSRVYNEDPAQQAHELMEAWHRATTITRDRPEELNGMRGVIRKFLVDQQDRFGSTATDSEWFRELAHLIDERRKKRLR